MPLPSVLIYSYWLVTWAVLSLLHVLPVSPPTLSLGLACIFNAMAAFLLPWVGVYVGSGTAAYSTRVMIVTLESVVFVAALYYDVSSVLSLRSLFHQALVLLVYVIVARVVYAVRPIHIYTVHIPRALRGMAYTELVKMRIDAPFV